MLDARDHLKHRWRNIHSRCYGSNAGRRRYYNDVVVHPEWHDFENFYCWAIDQDFIGKHLDKDIVGNSLVYGPDTCVFVNPVTNFFFQRRADEDNRGVCYNGSGYSVACSNPLTGVNERLGNYSSKEEGKMAYLLRKYYHACLLADFEDDVRVKNALLSKFYVDENAIPLHVILKLQDACEKYY